MMSASLLTRAIVPRFTRQSIVRCVSSFKSDISVDTLYPASPGPVKHEEIVKDIVSQAGLKESQFNGYIPVSELTVAHTSETGVDMRFHVKSATWLSDDTKARIAEQLSDELTRDGWLVVRSDRTTTRTLNMADALEKLRANIRAAENPVSDSYPLLEREMARKARLKAARQRLHIKVE